MPSIRIPLEGSIRHWYRSPESSDLAVGHVYHFEGHCSVVLEPGPPVVYFFYDAALVTLGGDCYLRGMPVITLADEGRWKDPENRCEWIEVPPAFLAGQLAQLGQPVPWPIRDAIEFGPPPCPVRLEGRTAYVLMGGCWTRAGLTEQQAAFLAALINAYPDAVSTDRLRTSCGLRYPGATARAVSNRLPGVVVMSGKKKLGYKIR